MQFVYAGMWLAIGLLLIFRFGREYKLLYAVGAFFLFMAAWWGYGAFTATDMFAGTRGVVFRVVTAAAIVVLAPLFVRLYRRERAGQAGERQAGQPDAENMQWLDDLQKAAGAPAPQDGEDRPGPDGGFPWYEEPDDGKGPRGE